MNTQMMSVALAVVLQLVRTGAQRRQDRRRNDRDQVVHRYTHQAARDPRALAGWWAQP
jgi:hypothetical protein